IDVIDHVRGILPVSLSAFGITGIAFTLLGFRLGGGSADMTQVNSVMAALQENFHISLFAFVPMLVVIILLILKMPSLPVISFGAGLGIVWGIIFQGLTPVKAISTAWVQLEMNTGIEFIDSLLSRGGMNSMLWSVAIIILGLGFGGLLDRIGIIKAIAGKVYQHINNGGTLTVFTIIVGFLGCLLGSAMYVSLVLTPKIMAEKYDEMGYSRRVLSRNAEIGGTLTAGMIPWSDNGIYMATILGVATFEYLPYMWLSFSCIALAIIFGFTGLFMWKNKNAV
ncbi:MAG TPA: Na+/H+ antiporter NhaC family protein, partial [Lachnospira sp.]|nr:Na+/H+ antiporter NhaC family protein [Lachnospira sp.]